MEIELVSAEKELVAPAIAIGAVCGMAAVFILFPLIDRWIRPRFKLERGSALLLLLIGSLFFAVSGTLGAYFWLQKDSEQIEEKQDRLQEQS